MENPGGMGLQCHWDDVDPTYLKNFLNFLAERDAAVAERDTAIAERNTAFAERDSALIQRDIAYTDRDTAWMERDAAIAALSMIRSGKGSSDTVVKLIQTLNMSAVPEHAEGVPFYMFENDSERYVNQQGGNTSESKGNIPAIGTGDMKIMPPVKRRRM